MSKKPLNSGLLVAIGLPLFAIVASVGVMVVAFTRGDPTLPDEYHWEGMSLDRDFADAHHASELNVHATLRMLASPGMCQVALNLGAAAPAALSLNLVHATHPELDRHVRLARVNSTYEGYCGALPSGHWHLELSDPAGNWSVRGDVSGAIDGSSLSAG